MGFIGWWFTCALVLWVYEWLFVYPEIFEELKIQATKEQLFKLYEETNSLPRLMFSTLVVTLALWWFTVVMLAVFGVKRYREQFIEVYKKVYVDK